MTRITLVLLALLALLGTPALCAGGALDHECPCDVEGEGCDHETDCPDDPCGDLMRTPSDSASRLSEHAWVLAPLPVPALPLAPALCLLPESSGGEPLVAGLPYPVSDRPLRV